MPVEVMKDFDAVLVRGYDARMDPVLLRARGIRRQNSPQPARCSTSVPAGPASYRSSVMKRASSCTYRLGRTRLVWVCSILVKWCVRSRTEAVYLNMGFYLPLWTERSMDIWSK